MLAGPVTASVAAVAAALVVLVAAAATVQPIAGGVVVPWSHWRLAVGSADAQLSPTVAVAAVVAAIGHSVVAGVVAPSLCWPAVAGEGDVQQTPTAAAVVEKVLVAVGRDHRAAALVEPHQGCGGQENLLKPGRYLPWIPARPPTDQRGHGDADLGGIQEQARQMVHHW